MNEIKLSAPLMRLLWIALLLWTINAVAYYVVPPINVLYNL